jgi:spore maturation protein CgeB
MEEMFRVNEELVTYADEDELIELTKYYLYVEGEREAVGKKAQEKAYNKHTYEKRITELISKV